LSRWQPLSSCRKLPTASRIKRLMNN
jgi:hypothetical protein